MGFVCGIIGLPNAGKSTIFNALAAAHAEVASYPFCTINPNQGIVPVPDERLQRLAEILRPQKVTPAVLEFWDIAGLVKGASQGEGLGNRFLSHIRNVDVLAHVVRCFEHNQVAHIYGAVDPRRDIEIVQTELLLADLQILEKRLGKEIHQAKVGNKKAASEIPILQDICKQLASGRIPHVTVDSSEEEKKFILSLELLSPKPVVYVANVNEAELKQQRYVPSLEKWAAREQAPVVILCGDLEAELAQLPPADRQEFLREMDVPHSGLDQLVRAGYERLHLVTFYTTVGTELRAWTVPQGTAVPQAAGKIHTDMERGFIRAEVIAFNVFMAAGSMTAAREKGWIRIEGKDYIIQDGDILHIRFHA